MNSCHKKSRTPAQPIFSLIDWLCLAITCALLLTGCRTTGPVAARPAAQSGRELVLQALTPVKGKGGVVEFGVVSTALSSSAIASMEPLKHLNPQETPGGQPFSLMLADGTRVEGLFFEYVDGTAGAKPLLMASFGFLQDRWGTEAAKFYDLYLKDPSQRIPAHVLILDHPTAGPFLANNGHLSMGSYDDARMWIEVAVHVRDRMNLSGIHLFGVSMSGQTVVHALIEDKRLGLNLFDSGVAVSIAPDFKQAPGKQLAFLKTAAGVENPWKGDFKSPLHQTLMDDIQCATLGMLIKNQFVPHYRYTNIADAGFDLQPEQAAVFLRKAFGDRIAFLRNNAAATWDKAEVDLTDLDAFMASTRIARVIGRVRTPLVLVSSLDDPAVEHPMFAEVMQAAGANPWIAAYETDHGGHFGFDVVYGADYLREVIRLMMTPQVLDAWNGPMQ